MSATTFLVVAAAAWVLIGVGAGLAMGRRGHSAFGWLLMGAVFGPLVVPLAVYAARDEQRAAAPLELGPGEAGSGPVDVLVGIDGSDASQAALRAALGLLGERIGRLSIASVVEHGETPAVHRDEERAAELLGEMAATVAGRVAATAILRGDPATALGRHAAEGGFELLVVGRRGRGATKALLGSTATHLARSPEVPVLIV